VTRYYGQDALTSVEQAKQFVEFFAKNYNEKRGIRWGIEIKGHQGIIGTIGFNALFTKHKRAEIGYELHPEYWQKGYATEAVSEVISYGFKELDLTRIGAVVFIENVASNELLIKLGFEKEGVLRNYMYQNGVPYDTNVYSLLKSI
jgi:ribosomal-protein-alanine N-acetyltransferase